MKEEEKPAPVEEEGKENATAESSEPEAATVVEDSHAAAPEEDSAAPEEDGGDSRQHLNVVFIGHVGTEFVVQLALFELRHSRQWVKASCCMFWLCCYCVSISSQLKRHCWILRLKC